MNKKRIDISLFMMKSMVLIISACYILGPIRQEISVVLHTAWHTLEIPDQVLSHNTGTKTTYKEHNTHEHKAMDEEHIHEALSFIDEVIQSIMDDPFSSEVPLEKLTHYKHINDELITYTVAHNLWILKKIDYPLAYQKTKKGYRLTLKEPPRYIV